MYHFLQSELLSRRLAYYCCKRIYTLFNEFSNSFFEKAVKQLQLKQQQQQSKQPPQQQHSQQQIKTEPQISTVSNDSNKPLNYILKNELPIKSVISNMFR